MLLIQRFLLASFKDTRYCRQCPCERGLKKPLNYCVAIPFSYFKIQISFSRNMGIIPSKKKKNRQSTNGTVKRPTIVVKEEPNCCKRLYLQTYFLKLVLFSLFELIFGTL